jgi:hypothetical protein
VCARALLFKLFFACFIWVYFYGVIIDHVRHSWANSWIVKFEKIIWRKYFYILVLMWMSYHLLIKSRVQTISCCLFWSSFLEAKGHKKMWYRLPASTNKMGILYMEVLLWMSWEGWRVQSQVFWPWRKIELPTWVLATPLHHMAEEDRTKWSED